jgi:hypothetical protein
MWLPSIPSLVYIDSLINIFVKRCITYLDSIYFNIIGQIFYFSTKVSYIWVFLGEKNVGRE